MKHSIHSARILRFMRRPLISMMSAGSMLFFYPASAFSVPSDGLVVNGSATISQNGSTTTVDQSSARAVIDWRSFDTAANEVVRFNQPGSDAAVLNRITGGSPTNFMGQLVADGKVFVVNPNGIVFGAGSKIDVGGLVAGTLSIRDDDFMNGRDFFTQDASKANSYVVNRGEIHIADNGFCFLVAPGVSNKGTIVAQLGKVVMASAKELTLDFNGDGLMTYTVSGKVLDSVLGPDGKPLGSAVDNSGTIRAKGGEIVMLSDAGAGVFPSVVNNSGVLEAGALEAHGGMVVLTGGDEGLVSNSGTIDVSGSESGQKGGTVKVLGDRVGLFAGTKIDASGAAGGGTVLVGGDFQGKNPAVRNADRTFVAADAQIRADALEAGSGGKVIVWSDDVTGFYGSISARGGVNGGNGGFAEVSGKGYLDYGGYTDLRAPMGSTGTLLLDPNNIVIGSSADINANLATGDDVTGNILAGDYSGATSYITATRVSSLLDSANLSLSATNDIGIYNAVSWNSGYSFSLNAGHNIIVCAPVTNSGIGSINFTAGNAVLLGSSITTGGTINLTATNGYIARSAGTLTANTVTLVAATGIGYFGCPVSVYTDTETLNAVTTGYNAGIYVADNGATGPWTLADVNVKVNNGDAYINPVTVNQLRDNDFAHGSYLRFANVYASETTKSILTGGFDNVSFENTGGGVYVGDRYQYSAVSGLEVNNFNLSGQWVSASHDLLVKSSGDMMVYTKTNTSSQGNTTLVSGGPLSLYANVGNATAGKSTSLTSTGSYIKTGMMASSGSTSVGSVTGETVSLSAVTGIGQSITTPIYVDADVLNLVNTGYGNNVYTNNPVAVSSIYTDGGTSFFTLDDVNVRVNNGDVYINPLTINQLRDSDYAHGAYLRFGNVNTAATTKSLMTGGFENVSFENTGGGVYVGDRYQYSAVSGLEINNFNLSRSWVSAANDVSVKASGDLTVYTRLNTSGNGNTTLTAGGAIGLYAPVGNPAAGSSTTLNSTGSYIRIGTMASGGLTSIGSVTGETVNMSALKGIGMSSVNQSIPVDAVTLHLNSSGAGFGIYVTDTFNTSSAYTYGGTNTLLLNNVYVTVNNGPVKVKEGSRYLNYNNTSHVWTTGGFAYVSYDDTSF